MRSRVECDRPARGPRPDTMPSARPRSRSHDARNQRPSGQPCDVEEDGSWPAIHRRRSDAKSAPNFGMTMVTSPIAMPSAAEKTSSRIEKGRASRFRNFSSRSRNVAKPVEDLFAITRFFAGGDHRDLEVGEFAGPIRHRRPHALAAPFHVGADARESVAHTRRTRLFDQESERCREVDAGVFERGVRSEEREPFARFRASQYGGNGRVASSIRVAKGRAGGRARWRARRIDRARASYPRRVRRSAYARHRRR